MLKPVLVLLLSTVAYSVILSQHDMQRFGFYSPLDQIRSNENRFMHSMDFIGLGESGYGSRDEALKYNLVFGGAGIFYRWDNSALWFSVVGNVIANPYNDIGFDPYGASWQEEIRYSHDFGYGIWEIGFSHRCRHEIDNFDPGEMQDEPTKRVTLYAGPVFGFLSKKIDISNRIDFTWGIDGQYIVVASDHRSPENDLSPSLENLSFKLTPHIEAYYHLWEMAKLFVRGINTLNLIEREIYFLSRAELGLQLNGNAGNIEVYGLYEKMFEDYTSPLPQSNKVTSLGIRFRSNIFR